MIIRALRLILAILVMTSSANAQSGYPNRPIRIVVGYPAGGATDAVARVMANYLSEKLPSRAIVENRPGAGANLAAENVARSEPNGYSLLFTQATTHGISPAAYAKLNYDPVTDFTPISFIASAPLVLLANKNIPANNLDELRNWAAQQKRALTVGYYGNGTSAHLTTVLLQSKSEIDLLPVPYRGGAPAMQDILSGQIDLVVDVVSNALPQIEGGTVRAIGVTTKAPSALLPGVEPLGKYAAGIDIETWFGVVAPAGTPRSVIDFLAGEFSAALNDPAIQQALTKLGVVAKSMPPAEFGTFIHAELARWKTIVDEANIKIE